VGRDKIQVALKNESKRILLLLLSQLADYVNLTAQGNENNIYSLATCMEDGTSPLQLLKSTKELYTVTIVRPAAAMIDIKRIAFFIF
jgi:hypothetical protein